MLNIFLILFLISACIGRISKYHVPYEYLLTLNHVGGPNSVTRTSFEQNLTSWFQKTCKDGTCFLAVYNNSTNSEEMFQILDRRENPCLNTFTGNCLLFTKEEYNYSFIYEQEKTEAVHCPRPNTDSDFVVPTTCEPGWRSFLRENGRWWCYQVFKGKMEFHLAQQQCEMEPIRAQLYGFETNREFNDFSEHVDKFIEESGASDEYVDRHVWIGARRLDFLLCDKNRSWPIEYACKEKPLIWLNDVSRTPGLFRTNFDGSGDCLAYAKSFNGLDDYECNKSLPFYACGKYAV